MLFWINGVEWCSMIGYQERGVHRGCVERTSIGMGSRLLSTFLFPPVLRQRLLHCGFNTQADVQELQPLELAKGASE